MVNAMQRNAKAAQFAATLAILAENRTNAEQERNERNKWIFKPELSRR
jgi:hypothetical protein